MGLVSTGWRRPTAADDGSPSTQELPVTIVTSVPAYTVTPLVSDEHGVAPPPPPPRDDRSETSQCVRVSWPAGDPWCVANNGHEHIALYDGIGTLVP